MKWPVKGRSSICEWFQRIPQLRDFPAWALFIWLSSPLLFSNWSALCIMGSWKLVSWKETIFPEPEKPQTRFGSVWWSAEHAVTLSPVVTVTVALTATKIWKWIRVKSAWPTAPSCLSAPNNKCGMNKLGRAGLLCWVIRQGGGRQKQKVLGQGLRLCTLSVDKLCYVESTIFKRCQWLPAQQRNQHGDAILWDGIKHMETTNLMSKCIRNSYNSIAR